MQLTCVAVTPESTLFSTLCQGLRFTRLPPPALPMQSMDDGKLRTRIKRISNVAKLKSFISVGRLACSYCACPSFGDERRWWHEIATKAARGH